MTDATALSDSNAENNNPGYGSKPYRTYVLSALTLIYV